MDYGMKPISGSSEPEKKPAAGAKDASKQASLQSIVSKSLSPKAVERPSMDVQLTAADDSLIDCIETILDKPNPKEILRGFFEARTPSDFSQKGLLEAKYLVANFLTADTAMDCLKVIDGIKATLPKTAEATAIKADGIVIVNSGRKPSVIPISQNPPSKLTPEDIILIKIVQTGTNEYIESATWQDNISPAGVKEALTAAQQSKRGDHIISFLTDRLDSMASPDDDWKSVSSDEDSGQIGHLPAPNLIHSNLEIIFSNVPIRSRDLTEDSLIELLKRNPNIKVVWLDLSNSPITKITEILDLCPQIRHLTAINCQITDELARQIAVHPNSKRLEKLILCRNEISDVGAGHIATMTGLELLDLEGNEISDKVIRSIHEKIPTYRNYSEDGKSDDEDYKA